MVRGGLALPRGAVLATLASLVDELHGSIHRLYRACVDSLCVCVHIFRRPLRRIATMPYPDFAILLPSI